MTNIDEFIFKNWNVQRENSIHHECTAKWVFKKWMHGCAEHWTKNITFLEPWQPSSRVTTALASCATDPFCQALNLILMGSHRAHSSVSGSHCLMWRLWDLCTRVGVPWSVPFSLLRSILLYDYIIHPCHCWWALGLFPAFCYYKYCCYEQYCCTYLLGPAC